MQVFPKELFAHDFIQEVPENGAKNRLLKTADPADGNSVWTLSEVN